MTRITPAAVKQNPNFFFIRLHRYHNFNLRLPLPPRFSISAAVFINSFKIPIAIFQRWSLKIGYMYQEAVAIGKTFAGWYKEMVALGSMNIIGPLTSCYVSTGIVNRFSRIVFEVSCQLHGGLQ